MNVVPSVATPVESQEVPPTKGPVRSVARAGSPTKSKTLATQHAERMATPTTEASQVHPLSWELKGIALDETHPSFNGRAAEGRTAPSAPCMRRNAHRACRACGAPRAGPGTGT